MISDLVSQLHLLDKRGRAVPVCMHQSENLHVFPLGGAEFKVNTSNFLISAEARSFGETLVKVL